MDQADAGAVAADRSVQGAEPLILIPVAGDQELIDTIMTKIDASIATQIDIDLPLTRCHLLKGTTRQGFIEFLEHVGIVPDEAVQFVRMPAGDALDALGVRRFNRERLERGTHPQLNLLRL